MLEGTSNSVTQCLVHKCLAPDTWLVHSACSVLERTLDRQATHTTVLVRVQVVASSSRAASLCCCCLCERPTDTSQAQPWLQSQIGQNRVQAETYPPRGLTSHIHAAHAMSAAPTTGNHATFASSAAHTTAQKCLRRKSCYLPGSGHCLNSPEVRPSRAVSGTIPPSCV
jgi:hypothetical protein